MKKILLATTMLVGTAGFAAAEVTLSGDARMGITGASDGDTTYSSRARVSFNASGETDGGLAFGASFRADNAGGASTGDAGSVYISGAFGKLSMGDLDSADNVGQLSGVGFTGLGDSNEVEYSADGVGLLGFASAFNAAEEEACHDSFQYFAAASCLEAGYGVTSASTKVGYTYSADNFSVSASTSQNGGLSSVALGATYKAGDLTVGAGYGKNDVELYTWVAVGAPPFVYDGPTEDIWVEGDVTDVTLFASYTMGATTIKGIYQNKELSATTYYPDDSTDDLSGSADTYGISVDHTIDALTLTGFAITTEASDAISGGLGSSDDADTATLTRYGVGASYDLGGGASVVGGVARVESMSWDINNAGPSSAISADVVSDTVYDLGVKFAF